MAFIGTPLDTRNTFQSLAGKRFNGDGSTTAFTLDVAPSSTLDIEVFVGNVRQDPNSAYTLSGTTLTFTGAPPSGTNNIYVVHQAKSVGTIDPPATETVAKTFSGAVTHSSTTLVDTLGVNSAKDLGTGIHIKTADSGASVSANADELVIEGSGNTGITIASGNSSGGNIFFADDGGVQRGKVAYDHSADSMTLRSGNTDSLIIDSAGHVTMPNQSAFLVSPSSTLSNVTGDHTNYDVVFATEVIDRNADFSSATFTAPVTGIYAFHAILEVEGVTDSHTQCVAFFNASNRSYYIKNDDGGNYHASGGLYMNFSGIIDMDANDTVTLQLDFRNGSKVVDVGSGSYWGGYLVA
jgi:hypothetical protein